MKKGLLAIVGASLLLLTACGQTADNNTSNNDANTGSQQQAAGPEEIAKQNCSSCHGGNLQGNFGPSLEKIGSKMTKEEIIEVLDKGIGSMPPQTKLTPEQKEELATWLSEKK